MVDKGNVDKHRRSMSGVKAQETEKWGRDTARERYGSLKQGGMTAKDTHGPQAPTDKQAPGYANIHRNDWIRGAGESAEGKPNFQSGFRGKR
jgi:hypothetical protein